jgi:multicomponent Na+:H+ antiporter subunit B
MSRRARIAVFALGAAGFAALLVWGVAGLEPFGSYPGPYGDVLNRVEPGQRRAANVVAAVVFDYRGVDTLGEELILFAAVMGVALLLRERREDDAAGIVDAVRSEALRTVGILAVPVVVLLGLYTIAHGYLTPGGGFQGGVVAATGLLLVYLAAEWRAFRHAAPHIVVESVESGGAAGYTVVGLAMLVAGGAFLENLLPLGTFGRLDSTGEIAILNWCAGAEVTAAFVLLYSEFLAEIVIERKRDGVR